MCILIDETMVFHDDALNLESTQWCSGKAIRVRCIEMRTSNHDDRLLTNRCWGGPFMAVSCHRKQVNLWFTENRSHDKNSANERAKRNTNEFNPSGMLCCKNNLAFGIWQQIAITTNSIKQHSCWARTPTINHRPIEQKCCVASHRQQPHTKQQTAWDLFVF